MKSQFDDVTFKYPTKEELNRTLAIFESISQIDFLLAQRRMKSTNIQKLSYKQKIGLLVVCFYGGDVLSIDLPKEYQS